jgi:hypothetical protein
VDWGLALLSLLTLSLIPFAWSVYTQDRATAQERQTQREKLTWEIHTRLDRVVGEITDAALAAGDPDRIPSRDSTALSKEMLDAVFGEPGPRYALQNEFTTRTLASLMADYLFLATDPLERSRVRQAMDLLFQYKQQEATDEILAAVCLLWINRTDARYNPGTFKQPRALDISRRFGLEDPFYRELRAKAHP